MNTIYAILKCIHDQSKSAEKKHFVLQKAKSTEIYISLFVCEDNTSLEYGIFSSIYAYMTGERRGQIDWRYIPVVNIIFAAHPSQSVRSPAHIASICYDSSVLQ